MIADLSNDYMVPDNFISDQMNNVSRAANEMYNAYKQDGDLHALESAMGD
jgi:hypothetical protein